MPPTPAHNNERLGDFLLGDCIGKGGFGAVYKALNTTDGSVVAVKKVKIGKMSKQKQKTIMGEIELLRTLKHPSIVEYRGYVRQGEYLNIILEYIENGSLQSIMKRFGQFPERLISVYTKQVLVGLTYLHDQGVIHRDIKGANILTTKAGTVKLADFGVATQLQDQEEGSVVGTPYWMAPEIISLCGAREVSDVWSVGCTVVELLTGNPPYFNLAPMPALFRIVQDDHPPIPSTVSPVLMDFLMQTFIKEPNMRMNAKKALRHPYIQQVAKSSNEVPVTEALETQVAVIMQHNDTININSTALIDTLVGSQSRLKTRVSAQSIFAAPEQENTDNKTTLRSTKSGDSGKSRESARFNPRNAHPRQPAAIRKATAERNARGRKENSSAAPLKPQRSAAVSVPREIPQSRALAKDAESDEDWSGDFIVSADNESDKVSTLKITSPRLPSSSKASPKTDVLGANRWFSNIFKRKATTKKGGALKGTAPDAADRSSNKEQLNHPDNRSQAYGRHGNHNAADFARPSYDNRSQHSHHPQPHRRLQHFDTLRRPSSPGLSRFQENDSEEGLNGIEFGADFGNLSTLKINQNDRSVSVEPSRQSAHTDADRHTDTGKEDFNVDTLNNTATVFARHQSKSTIGSGVSEGLVIEDDDDDVFGSAFDLKGVDNLAGRLSRQMSVNRSTLAHSPHKDKPKRGHSHSLSHAQDLAPQKKDHNAPVKSGTISGPSPNGRSAYRTERQPTRNGHRRQHSHTQQPSPDTIDEWARDDGEYMHTPHTQHTPHAPQTPHAPHTPHTQNTPQTYNAQHTSQAYNTQHTAHKPYTTHSHGTTSRPNVPNYNKHRDSNGQNYNKHRDSGRDSRSSNGSTASYDTHGPHRHSLTNPHTHTHTHTPDVRVPVREGSAHTHTPNTHEPRMSSRDSHGALSNSSGVSVPTHSLQGRSSAATSVVSLQQVKRNESHAHTYTHTQAHMERDEGNTHTHMHTHMHSPGHTPTAASRSVRALEAKDGDQSTNKPLNSKDQGNARSRAASQKSRSSLRSLEMQSNAVAQAQALKEVLKIDSNDVLKIESSSNDELEGIDLSGLDVSTLNHRRATTGVNKRNSRSAESTLNQSQTSTPSNWSEKPSPKTRPVSVNSFTRPALVSVDGLGMGSPRMPSGMSGSTGRSTSINRSRSTNRNRSMNRSRSINKSHIVSLPAPKENNDPSLDVFGDTSDDHKSSDDDFGAAFSGSINVNKLELRKVFTQGSEDETVSNLSLQSDSSDDDDPFAEIDEEEFTEYDENEAYEREQSLHITTEVESLTEQLETATGTQIEEVADKLTSMIRMHPDLCVDLITSHGLVRLVELLEAVQHEDLYIPAVLSLVNEIVMASDTVQESLSLIGIIPAVTKFFDDAYPPPVQNEAARFVHNLCYTSPLALQMFVACRGLPTLTAMLRADMHLCSPVVEAAVDSLFYIFDTQTAATKNDFSRLLMRTSTTANLVTILQVMALNLHPRESTDNTTIKAAELEWREGDSNAELLLVDRINKIVSTLLCFSLSDSVVKVEMCRTGTAAYLLSIAPTLPPNERLLTVKCIKNLTTEATALDILESSDVVQSLIQMLSLSSERPVTASSKERDIYNNVLSALYNLCKVNKRRQELAAASGIIPILKQVIEENNPVKQLALPIICDIGMCSRKTRLELYKNDGINLFNKLLQDPNFQATAMDVLSTWLADAPAQVEPILSQTAQLDTMINAFARAKSPYFDLMLEPLHRTVEASQRINTLLAEGRMVRIILRRLNTYSARPNVLLALLKIIHSLFDASTDAHRFVTSNGIVEAVQPFTQNASVMVGEVTRQLLHKAEMSIQSPPTRSRHDHMNAQATVKPTQHFHTSPYNSNKSRIAAANRPTKGGDGDA